MSSFAMPDDVHLPLVTDLSRPERTFAAEMRGFMGAVHGALHRLTFASLAHYGWSWPRRNAGRTTTAHG
jgi:hypothetical protein